MNLIRFSLWMILDLISKYNIAKLLFCACFWIKTRFL